MSSRFVWWGISLAALLVLSARARAGVTLRVGPGKAYATPCAAIGAAGVGDTVEVDAAGDYDGDTCAWSTDNLTIRGVGGRAHIDLTGVSPAQKKGIFTIAATSATIENFELSGAAISVADGNNGAAIRHQGLNLTVRNCYLHDNQNGILGAPSSDGLGVVLVEYSELAHNGAGDGFSHNLYVNHYASFTLRYSYSHHANVGHLVKTRARENVVAYNRLTGESGTGSYELDIPNGGRSMIIGNLIQQGASSQNPTLVTSGEEGTSNPDQHFDFINNTVVNDRASGTFVNLAPGTTALLQNNIFRGSGTVSTLAGATLTSNWTDADGDPRFIAPASYDYRLQAASLCVDGGTTPGVGLVPDHQYVHVAATEPRSLSGSAIDIGAYEVAVSGPVDAGVGGAIDAGVAVRGDARAVDARAVDAATSAPEPSADGGCAVAVGNRPLQRPWVIALAVVAVVARGARRRTHEVPGPPPIG